MFLCTNGLLTGANSSDRFHWQGLIDRITLTGNPIIYQYSPSPEIISVPECATHSSLRIYRITVGVSSILLSHETVFLYYDFQSSFDDTGFWDSLHLTTATEPTK